MIDKLAIPVVALTAFASAQDLDNIDLTKYTDQFFADSIVMPIKKSLIDYNSTGTISADDFKKLRAVRKKHSDFFTIAPITPEINGNLKFSIGLGNTWHPKDVDMTVSTILSSVPYEINLQNRNMKNALANYLRKAEPSDMVSILKSLDSMKAVCDSLSPYDADDVGEIMGEGVKDIFQITKEEQIANVENVMNKSVGIAKEFDDMVDALKRDFWDNKKGIFRKKKLRKRLPVFREMIVSSRDASQIEKKVRKLVGKFVSDYETVFVKAFSDKDPFPMDYFILREKPKPEPKPVTKELTPVAKSIPKVYTPKIDTQAVAAPVKPAADSSAKSYAKPDSAVQSIIDNAEQKRKGTSKDTSNVSDLGKALAQADKDTSLSVPLVDKPAKTVPLTDDYYDEQGIPPVPLVPDELVDKDYNKSVPAELRDPPVKPDTSKSQIDKKVKKVSSKETKETPKILKAEKDNRPAEDKIKTADKEKKEKPEPIVPAKPVVPPKPLEECIANIITNLKKDSNLRNAEIKLVKEHYDVKGDTIFHLTLKNSYGRKDFKLTTIIDNQKTEHLDYLADGKTIDPKKDKEYAAALSHLLGISKNPVPAAVALVENKGTHKKGYDKRRWDHRFENKNINDWKVKIIYDAGSNHLGILLTKKSAAIGYADKKADGSADTRFGKNYANGRSLDKKDIPSYEGIIRTIDKWL